MRSEVQKLPELFLERLRRIVPSQKWDTVANTFTEATPTTFRMNTLKVGVQSIAAQQEKLEHLGFGLEKASRGTRPVAAVPFAKRFGCLPEGNLYPASRGGDSKPALSVPALPPR